MISVTVHVIPILQEHINFLIGNIIITFIHASIFYRLITLKIKGKLNFVNSTFETAVKLCEQVPNLSTFAVTCTTVSESHS